MNTYIQYKGMLPSVDKDAYISDSADLIGNILIGKDSSIWFKSVLRGDINRITVGERTNIQDNTVVHLSSKYGTEIGNNVTIGHSSIIHGCTIKDNILIGMGACILDGAIIASNCIVGARALVTKNKIFEEGSLIIGSPAKAVRKLSTEEIESIKISADHYVEYSKEYKVFQEI